MQGKSRFWIVACCILEIIYGLVFMSMGVVGSYLWQQTSSSTLLPQGAIEASNAISNWQSSRVPITADRQMPVQVQRHISDHGIWLAIFYILTGFCGVIAGQEKDRILPLLHTVMALICIIWTPLMWETLYLLVRPSSNFAYSFLNEMDFITSQRHWAAYIVSICVVVAGSFLFLLSAALSAYQYGIRMISTKSSKNKLLAVSTSLTSGRLKTAANQALPQQQTATSLATSTRQSLKTGGKGQRGSPLANHIDTTTGNGSVNVDMEDIDGGPSSSIAGANQASSSIAYHHHERLEPTVSSNRSSLHYLNQPLDHENSQFVHTTTTATSANRPVSSDRRAQTFDRREQKHHQQMLTRHSNNLAFSSYYDDAQEAIV